MVNNRVGVASSRAVRRVRRDRASAGTANSNSKSYASESESESKASASEAAGTTAAAATGARQMVSASLRRELEKQGYRVVGSHSGVKLCRWTKSCTARTRRLLQAHVLWHREPPVRRDDAVDGLRQQMRVLLAAPHESCGD